ncbi:MAG: ATP-dependent DNA helicase RecQ [Acidobacteriaceae bacterium]|nr:ATP-dependent DNA helicase RecQ [Acidobacteriaceae bacterium]
MTTTSRRASPTNAADIDIETAAKKLLGFQSLRPGQEKAIRALQRGQDTLVVQPTGSGKSAIYQIAGALLPGSTIIISPLIALQKDQVEAIEASRLEHAAVFNSTLSAGERRETLERMEGGEVEYIFLAPEQLRSSETLARFRAAGIALVVVDEAHCISEWGHDFRPDYLDLGHVLEALDRPPCLAMTATASREVRKDIVERLRLRDPLVMVRGFDRPNISLRVDTYAKREEKQDALLRRVEFAEKPGIVYVATHKNAESIAADLRQRGMEALAYHGGMKARDRDDIQNRFMSGDVQVIVATNAFGMGVDKADVRFVYHADVSDSLDSYYQEIGRAGRDGKAAEAVLFYRPGDINSQGYKTGNGSVDTAILESVAEALTTSNTPLTPQEIGGEVGLSTRKVANIVHKLEEVGAARRTRDGHIEPATEKSVTEIVEDAAQQQGFQKELRRMRLEQMREYATTRSCRREHLLRYFGDDYTGPCGNCDRCEEAGVGNREVA